MEKELYRARDGRWLFGVCAGMAQYMGLTPMMVRGIFLLMTLFFGGGIFVYIASIFMIPVKPESNAPSADIVEGEKCDE